jgi:hypothetical protein
MSLDSGTKVIVIEENQSGSIFVPALETNNDAGGAWIQPPINRQIFDHAQSSLIDDIYVQIKPQEITLGNNQAITDFQDEFAAMASDPEIQREIRLIQDEFAGTDSDGLLSDS